MMVFIIRLIYMCIAMLLSHGVIYAVTYGSDSAVNRYTSLITLNNGDLVAAFGFLSAGCSLSSAAVNATVRTVFPLGGALSINGGTITLGHDLYFLNNATIASMGNIAANGYGVSLSSNGVMPTVVPGSVICYTWSNIKVELNADLTLQNSCIIFDGNSSIIGQGHILTLASTCTIQVKQNASLLLKDIIIKGINSSKIACLDTRSTLSLENVQWIQNGNYNFNAGKFDVLGRWSLEGKNYRFAYQTNKKSTIRSYATMELMPSFTFSYKPSIANMNLLAFSDSTAELLVSGATIHTSNVGLQLTKGLLTIDDHVFFANDGATSAQGIYFGDGISAANNLNIDWLAESGFDITSGFLIYDNV
jgi:hypothetical protein